MANSVIKHEWILLIHQLPPKPTNLRVKVWRKLQRLGAVAIKNSVYVLPFNEKTEEDFQWLKQEIEAAGGEASVFRAGSIEGATDEEIIKTFRSERDEEYAKATAELDSLTGTLKEQKRQGHLNAERIALHEAALDKLHADLERIIATDFFAAQKRSTANAAYKRCQKTLRNFLERETARVSKSAVKSDSSLLDRSEYQERRWVTRRNLHIDRLASGWLIKRFIDHKARFHFVSEGENVDGGIRFDMFGAEFTHVGEDCTFETLLKRFGLLNDAALQEIAEIVHDIDLKDKKFNRLEAAGLNSVVLGLSKLLVEDRKLLGQCKAIFDGLYEQFGQKEQWKNTDGN